jgi:hypothetical protein
MNPLTICKELELERKTVIDLITDIRNLVLYELNNFPPQQEHLVIYIIGKKLIPTRINEKPFK